jgi:hypothetical protein
MRKTIVHLALLGSIAAVPAFAQTAPAQTAPAPTAPTRTAPAQMAPDRAGANAPSARSESSPPAVTMDNGTRTTANPPAAGANSFTEGQARSRIEAAGFSGVDDLKKNDQGVWQGRATRNGQQVTVSLDYQGNVTTR